MSMVGSFLKLPTLFSWELLAASPTRKLSYSTVPYSPLYLWRSTFILTPSPLSINPWILSRPIQYSSRSQFGRGPIDDGDSLPHCPSPVHWPAQSRSLKVVKPRWYSLQVRLKSSLPVDLFWITVHPAPESNLHSTTVGL